MIKKVSATTKRAPSELRYDTVSGDWVVIATGRAKRPELFKKEAKRKLDDSKDASPFLDISTQEYPTAVFYRGKKQTDFPEDLKTLQWTTVAFPNKFPAFAPGISTRARTLGPYRIMDSVGFHEVIVTKHYSKDIPQFSSGEVKELIDMYQDRYLALMNADFVRHISIFKNKGTSAGASVAHPHSQLIAAPITDPDVQRSLRNSAEFKKQEGKCVHCIMLEWDRAEGSRIIFENKTFIAVCPFASRVAFEVRVYPKDHRAYFERTDEQSKQDLAEALRVAMTKLYKGLKDPDYNYFIHTAPADGKNYDHYHWHFEILPKTATFAGFELGTGIEISTIEPEKAAQFLREQHI